MTLGISQIHQDLSEQSGVIIYINFVPKVLEYTHRILENYIILNCHNYCYVNQLITLNCSYNFWMLFCLKKTILRRKRRTFEQKDINIDKRKQNYMRLDEFVENPDNPSIGTEEDIKRLEGKLTRVPEGLKAMRIAYVTDKIPGKKMVISGNKRLKALKKLHGDSVDLPDEWFQDVTSMSEAERHEFIVTANISDGHWDARKLLAQYDTSELSSLMDSIALSQLVSKTCEKGTLNRHKDTSEALDENNAVSGAGKIYKLGKHRLYVGDATKKESYQKLLGEKLADMLLTDPPYGIAIAGSSAKALTIANDNLHNDEFDNFLESFYINAFDAMKPGASYYIWHGDGDVERHFHNSILKVQAH